MGRRERGLDMTVKEIKPKPDKRTIEILELALEKAKSGELRSALVVGTLDQHESWSVYSYDLEYETVLWLGTLDLVMRDIRDLCSRRTPLAEQE